MCPKREEDERKGLSLTAPQTSKSPVALTAADSSFPAHILETGNHMGLADKFVEAPMRSAPAVLCESCLTPESVIVVVTAGPDLDIKY